jgi:hypothetical protein
MIELGEGSAITKIRQYASIVSLMGCNAFNSRQKEVTMQENEPRINKLLQPKKVCMPRWLPRHI